MIPFGRNLSFEFAIHAPIREHSVREIVDMYVAALTLDVMVVRAFWTSFASSDCTFTINVNKLGKLAYK